MLRSKCRTQTATTSVGDLGGNVRTWADSRTNVRCDIQPRSASKSDPFSQNEIEISHIIYFDADPVLGQGDRIIDKDDNIFEVVDGPRDTAYRGRLWVVGCRQVIGETT